MHPAFKRSSAFAAGLLAVLCAAPACRGLRPVFAPSALQDDTWTLPAAEAPPDAEPRPVAIDGEADWLELASGEWLRGELVRIRDDEVVFDSDELGSQTVGFNDVQSLRTATQQVVVTESRLTLRGKLTIVGDALWIEGARTVRVNREDLFATIHTDHADGVEWTGDVTLGATARSGNTQQNDFSAFASARRDTARTRWKSSYNGAISRANDDETANNHRVRSIYDAFVTRRVFVTVPAVDLYRDRFQNLRYRLTSNAAVGCEILDSGAHSWSVSAGPGYQQTRLQTASPGQKDDDGAAVGVLSSRYAWDVTDRVAFAFDYSIVAELDDVADYNHNFVMRLSVDLVGDLHLDLGFVWDRVSEPNADENGGVPEPDDYRTTVGLGWAF